jgi:hypothetical protein
MELALTEETSYRLVKPARIELARIETTWFVNIVWVLETRADGIGAEKKYVNRIMGM